ncbi:response regulator transcription factor [Aquimarina brevivitae]|uniref:LuxR family two component transcriptional regulator n=1 Tax=Aquimarina brevivitae TaxID=323412 RepID=A0A4Q7PHU9_9FLAO|nr:response regulator transcription factor [Aquimarina brevivitae]RZT00164.1 LuxR family two component transcriptional regulator [Aquimarina brevivitae]
MAYNIVIVDDHVLIADALAEIISKFNNFNVVYTCANGLDLQQKIGKTIVPEIILLDISMPEMDGFETAKWLQNKYPDILIMALSMQNDDASLIKMIKCGAKGYMLKNIKPAELEQALQQLAHKGRYFPEWAAIKVFDSLHESDQNATEDLKLSEREIEFLKYTTTEMSYKQIAEKMFCSPRTVENYRDSLFTKLEIKTRVGLAVYAVKNGFSIEEKE